MELQVTTASGSAATKKLEVSAATFDQEYNQGLIHQVVTAYMAGARQGTRAQKNRSAVSGGGAKPWKQKGTGRARAGTSRGPIWRKGGVTFAAQPQDHSQKVNRKMYRAAMRSILSELARSGRLIIVEKIDVAEPKTKLLLDQIKKMKVEDVLLVCDEVSENLYLASRNLYHIGICDAEQIDPVTLMAYKTVVMTTAAIKQIEERLA